MDPATFPAVPSYWPEHWKSWLRVVEKIHYYIVHLWVSVYVYLGGMEYRGQSL